MAKSSNAVKRLAMRQIRHTQTGEMQTMLRKETLYVAGLIALGFTALASGQMRQGPASLDDVLVELRGIRSDLAETSSASVRSQLLVARLQLQEQRITGLMRQIAEVQMQIAGARQQAQGAELQRMQQLLQELGNREAELSHQLSVEQGRWSEFSDRLDTLERSLPR
jgi:chromosome segregation ATPase